MNRVMAVVGGQYGSEGKGVIVHHLADEYDVHVRVGGPNAGHSFNHEGTVWKMQVLPCGWTNPNALLVLGRGMLINPELLVQEIEAVRRHDPSILNRLQIDEKAGILSPHHHVAEGGTEGEIHQRIGSTGEGVGAARVDRVKRNPDAFFHMRDVAAEYGTSTWSLDNVLVSNTPKALRHAVEQNGRVLLEGTQGFGLSLIHGTWPYVTSHDTTAGQLATDAGISPRLVTDILMVVRTFPIRVAGNSGPLYNELTWSEMSRRLGRTVEEKTTVTKKTRRIGEWDDALFLHALTVNAPTELAMMFADYLSPEDEGVMEFHHLSERSRRMVHYMQSVSGVPVNFIGTGGLRWNVIDRRGR